jgi:hypothetical protein
MSGFFVVCIQRKVMPWVGASRWRRGQAALVRVFRFSVALTSNGLAIVTRIDVGDNAAAVRRAASPETVALLV